MTPIPVYIMYLIYIIFMDESGLGQKKEDMWVFSYLFNNVSRKIPGNQVLFILVYADSAAVFEPRISIRG